MILKCIQSLYDIVCIFSVNRLEPTCPKLSKTSAQNLPHLCVDFRDRSRINIFCWICLFVRFSYFYRRTKSLKSPLEFYV